MREYCARSPRNDVGYACELRQRKTNGESGDRRNRSDKMVWRRRYQDDCVNGVGLVAHFGEMLFIVGPSGSGKTTLLSMISGILRPNAGKVVVKGDDIWTLNNDQLD